MTSPSISAFSIDPRSGALTPVAGSPFPAPAFPTIPLSRQSGSTVDPSGRFLYLMSTAGVLGYAIDPSSGALTPIAGSPFPNDGSDPLVVTVDPTGRYAYAAARDHVSGAYAVWAYVVDGTTGALTPVPGSPFSGGESDIMTSGVVDASGRFLYVSTGFDGGVVGYSIASASGALAPVAGSPFVVSPNMYGLAATATVRIQ